MPIAAATTLVAFAALVTLVTGISLAALVALPAFASLSVARTLIELSVSLAVARVRDNNARASRQGETGHCSNQRARFEHGSSLKKGMTPVKI